MSTIATINESNAPSATELGHLRLSWQRYSLYTSLILVLIFFAVVRVHLRNVPLERDEGEYAYSGQLILEGIPPYKLAYNMKLPGTYAAYAVIMGVFGEAPAGIRLGLLLVNAATSILLFFLARRLHGLLTGVVAGCTYALLSTRSSVLGFFGHATHFVVFFALAGILLLMHATDGSSPKRNDKIQTTLLFLSGFLLGLAFLMKQHGILLALFAGLYLLWASRRIPIQILLITAVIFAAGVALPYLLTCAILYREGVFREFWFWTVSYGRAYAAEMTLGDGLKMLRAVGPWMIRPFLIWGIVAAGLTALIWNKKVRQQAAFSVGFLIFSVLAVIPGYYFRPHYFIVLLPAVALWAGISVAATQEWLLEKPSWRRFSGLPVVIFSVAFAFSIHGQRNYFFRDPLTVSRMLYPGHGFPEALQVAAYVNANSSPQDTLGVIGSDPEIYFYSRRHSATGYIYVFGLMEPQEYAHQMQQQMEDELERSRPKYIVYVDDRASWQTPGYEAALIPFLSSLQGWISNQYQLEKEFAIPGGVALESNRGASFYIYRRKAD